MFLEATKPQENRPVNESVSMNTTATGSSSWSCFSLINHEAGKIGATVAYSFILVVSLVGNFLIVLIVYKTPTLRKPINMLIANMAMSDLLYPIFTFPVLVVKVHFGSWLISGFLGQALCKIQIFLAVVSLLVSIQSLVLITVDRFVAVVVPLRSPLITSKKRPLFIVATWTVAMAVQLLYFVAVKHVHYPEGIMCESQKAETFEEHTYANYLVVGAIVLFYTPFVLLVILYSIIMIKLKKQDHPGEQSANAEKQRTRRNRKVLKMAIAIVVVFFICWIPFFSNLLIMYFSSDSSIWSYCSFKVYYFVTYLMCRGNCAVNPIVCLTFSSKYRNGLKRLVTFQRSAL